jgi:hypothetical protein
MPSEYRVAGIDVHKMLAVVISDVAAAGDWEWERRTFGTLTASCAHSALGWLSAKCARW